MFKLDLHTHSSASADGGLSLEQYRAALKKFDYIAITDHNDLKQAQSIAGELGKGIIVGCEVSTLAGDLIGLFLNQPVPVNLELSAAIERIHQQGGLAMVPHPFEKRQRSSIDLDKFLGLADKIDIIETYNGRSLSPAARRRSASFALQHNIAQAACSDAHGPKSFGRAYSLIKGKPTPDNLVSLLKEARFVRRRSRLSGYLEPSFNRRRHRRAKIKPEN